MNKTGLVPVAVITAIVVILLNTSPLLPVVSTAMDNGFLPWVLVAALGSYYFVLASRIIIDFWQERAFRE